MKIKTVSLLLNILIEDYLVTRADVISILRIDKESYSQKDDVGDGVRADFFS